MILMHARSYGKINANLHKTRMLYVSHNCQVNLTFFFWKEIMNQLLYILLDLTFLYLNEKLIDSIQNEKRWIPSLLLFVDLSSYNAQLLKIYLISGKLYGQEF